MNGRVEQYGDEGSIGASQLQGLQFDPGLLSVWSCACSVDVHMSYLWVLWFSPTFQKHPSNVDCLSQIAPRCMCVCIHGALQWTKRKHFLQLLIRKC